MAIRGLWNSLPGSVLSESEEGADVAMRERSGSPPLFEPFITDGEWQFFVKCIHRDACLNGLSQDLRDQEVPGARRSGMLRKAKRQVLIHSPVECRRDIKALLRKGQHNTLQAMETAHAQLISGAFLPNDYYQDAQWSLLTAEAQDSLLQDAYEMLRVRLQRIHKAAYPHLLQASADNLTHSLGLGRGF